MPSFDEIWPQAGKSAAEKKRKRMGMEYILEAMQHHGLGHLPQVKYKFPTPYNLKCIQYQLFLLMV